MTDKQRAFLEWKALMPEGEDACCANPAHKPGMKCRREEAWRNYCVLRDAEIHEGRRMRVLRLIRNQEENKPVICAD